MKGMVRFLMLPMILLVLGMGLSGCGGSSTTTPSAPAAATNVAATPADGSAIISWDTVPTATSYNLYFSTTSGVKTNTGTRIANVTSPFDVSALTNGTTYFFVVTAVNSIGESAESAEVSVTPAPAPPRPTGIAATGGIGQVTVSWTNVTGAVSYNIYFSETTGVSKTNGTKFAGAGTPQTITGLVNGTEYFFVVTSVSAEGVESIESAERSATPSTAPQPPGRPTGVSATPGDGEVTITWTDVADATSYNIYWSTASPVTTATGNLVANVTSPHAVAGLTNGTLYFFVVTAINAGGESVESSEKSATPTVTLVPPASPNGVGAVAGPGAGEITMTWNTKLTAASYNIRYAESTTITSAELLAGGPGVTVHTVPALSPDPQPVTQTETVTGLTTGVTYSLIVTSVNAAGESAGQTNPRVILAP